MSSSTGKSGRERHTDPPGLADGTRLRVIAGNPTATEIAALVVALDRLPVPAAPCVPPVAGHPSAWLRAARQEALGGPPVAAPADLRRPR